MERPWIRHGNFDSDFKTTRPPGAEPASEPVSSQAWNYCRQNPGSHWPRCGHGVRTGRASSKPSGLLHMKTNMGLSHRAMRLFVDLTLRGLGTALDTPWGLLGVILLLTAAIGFCPL